MEHFHLYLGEFVGTACFMILGLGTIANISLKKSGMCGAGGLMAACGWGLGMVAVAAIFGPLTGAHVNPAVTIGFLIGGNFPLALVPGYFIAQFLGAYVGGILVWLVWKDHLDEEPEAGAKLGVFATAPSIRNPWRNCLAEATATFSLMFILLSLSHLQPAGGVAMFFVFAGVAGGVMAFAGLTGYAINPARDFAPRLVHAMLPIRGKGGSDWGYAWVPIVGPMLGGAAAGLLYNVLFRWQL